MEQPNIINCIIFALGDTIHALPIDSVIKVFPAVEITPIPEAPLYLLGVINIHGHVVSVFDIRSMFNLPSHELIITDLMIHFRSSENEQAVLIADKILGFVEINQTDIDMKPSGFIGVEYQKKSIIDQHATLQKYAYSMISKDNQIIFFHNPGNPGGITKSSE